MKSVSVVFLLLVVVLSSMSAQMGTISGVVYVEESRVELVQVAIEESAMGAYTDDRGVYEIRSVPYGAHRVTATHLGYESVTVDVFLSEDEPHITLDFALSKKNLQLDDVVVTGTKTPKRKTNSPVIVNVVNSQTMNNVQACNLSEGLRFQPGLRVETDCQTCNYTQLRMNGLAGGYSQILINGRPIFSPLTGLYGMEQLPTNMIDRIEVVRGGGSSLYGSSAIGGTVNVITKIPKNNAFELDYNSQSIDAQANDQMIRGNGILVSENGNAGISVFFNRREREVYDANDDNFSELPLLENTSLGANMFFMPTDNQKLELNLSYIHEYRYGGEMVFDRPAHRVQQSEERDHDVWMASADYQINLNEGKTSVISYLAWQNTDREHFTGILPDGTEEREDYLDNPPYGTSEVTTFNVGSQVNHELEDFLGGENVLTAGIEYLYDDVLDDIPAYGYLVDQTTRDLGLFLQSDWKITPQLIWLSGLRLDKHNLVNGLIGSPRTSLLYKWKDYTQFRLSYGTGFRAPQAFDTDLHIAFAGGGVSRVILSPDLTHERSQSFSASVNYDRPTEKWVAGFTLEAFYNRLDDAFFLQPIGQDAFGEVFEKRNGAGAKVRGLTLELRANYNRKLQWESGFTLQKSQFDQPVQYIDGLEGIREFTRTPNDYGYSILTYRPNARWNAVINYVYTGEMLVPHFAGAPNQVEDEIAVSDPFSEWSAKVGYTLPLQSIGTGVEFYGGVKNVFNAYQDDFDIGKNRDSNYIYGPSQPRTIYVGLKVKSL